MNHERIATLLASGLPAGSVASIVGVSPARISQLLKEPGFAELLASKQAETEAKDIEEISLAAKYHSVEHKLLTQLEELAPVSEIRDVVNALRVVAERQEKAKTRALPPPVRAPATYNIVNLTLPTHVLPEVQLNSNKEVIAIGERALSPLPSKAVTELFKKMDQAITVEGDCHVTSSSITAPEESNSEALSQEALNFLDSREPF